MLLIMVNLFESIKILNIALSYECLYNYSKINNIVENVSN